MLSIDHILPNIPRIYTALAEWLACIFVFLQIPRSDQRPWARLLLVIALPVQITLQFFAGQASLAFWIPGILINIGWMFTVLVLTETMSTKVKVYQCAKAFILAEFWASLAWQLYCYLINQTHPSFIITTIFMLACYAVLFAVSFWLDNSHTSIAPITITTIHDAFIATTLSITAFAISNMGFALFNTPFAIGSSTTIFMMRTLVDLCGLIVLKVQEYSRYENYLKRDITAVNNTLQLQYEQYQAYRENSQLVNQRFHDLKHQLDIIESESDNNRRLSYIKRLRQDISQFKADVKTGNPVADTILTRKNSYCIQHHITLSCIADGQLLNGIDTMDLCSLLGNTLDNAIEAVIKIPKYDQRLIDIKIVRKANFVLYSIRNYITNDIQLKDGLPQTTKQDKEQHGYGLKSVKSIVNKYDGSLTMHARDHWFSLRIMIPLAENTAKPENS